MKYEKGNYIFACSGRKFYANRYIGAFESKPYSGVEIAEGFDGYIPLEPTKDGEDDDDFSDEERTELADYMIAIWTKFKS